MEKKKKKKKYTQACMTSRGLVPLWQKLAEVSIVAGNVLAARSAFVRTAHSVRLL